MRKLILSLIATLLVSGPALAGALPSVIRVAVGTSGAFGKPKPSGLLGLGMEKGFFAQEFAKDHIQVQPIQFAGNGVAENEALANRQVDFSGGCTLPNVVGLAGWNDAHIVFLQRLGASTYILTNPGIHSFDQLRGKRIGVQFGNISHILTVSILAAHHIKESDVHWVNLPLPEQRAALISGSIDAMSGTAKDFALRDKGVVNVIGGTKDLPPLDINVCGTLVSGAFEKAYPQVVARFVKIMTKLAWWGSQPEHREEYLRYYSEASGIPYPFVKADTPDPLKPRWNPQFDAGVYQGYARAAQFALDHHLIRKIPDVKSWFEPQYVNAALTQLNLQKFWNTEKVAQAK